MLHKFFLFYSKFNANESELSPWTGKLESKSSITPSFSIFDPFEHNHNLTSNLSQTNWLKFQEECLLVNQILTESSKKRQNKSWGLSLILTRKSLPQKDYLHEQQYHHLQTKSTVDLILNQKNEEEIKKNVESILKDILLFEQVNYENIRKKRPASPDDEVTANNLAEQFDETLSGKRRRIDEDGYKLTPVKDIPYSKEKTYFQVIYRTWQDRRKLKRSIENEHKDVSVFERERLISQKLKEEKDHCLETPIYLAMEMKLLPTMNEKKLQVRFEVQTSEQHQLFIDLTHFLNLYLPKMIENPSSN